MRQWVKPSALFFKADMTAIAIIYTTPGGFIIAADGRAINPKTGEVRDSEQKIFECKCGRGFLSYAVMGDILGEKDYDLRIATAKHTEILCQTEIKDFDEYCMLLSDALKAELARAKDAGELHLPGKEVAKVFLLGYFDNRPVWTNLVFSNVRDSIEAVPPASVPLVNGQNLLLVSDIVPPKCLAGEPKLKRYRFYLDQELSKITLGGSANFCKALIGCVSDPCAKEFDPECEKIGGDFHMLEIRQTGFKWFDAQKKKGDPAGN